MTKLLLLFVLAGGVACVGGCGKKSPATLTPTSGSAKPADLKPPDGSDARPEPKTSSEEDPCAVPPSQ